MIIWHVIGIFNVKDLLLKRFAKNLVDNQEDSGEVYDQLDSLFFYCFWLDKKIFLMIINSQRNDISLFRLWKENLMDMKLNSISNIRSINPDREIEKLKMVWGRDITNKKKSLPLDFESNIRRKVFSKKSKLFRKDQHEVTFTSPFIESFGVVTNNNSQKIATLPYDTKICMRKIANHYLLDQKDFCLTCNYKNTPEDSDVCYLLFYDAFGKTNRIDSFLKELDFSQKDLKGFDLPNNPFRIKKLLQFDLDSNFRFICTFREKVSEHSGRRITQQIVEVVDFLSSDPIFQQVSLPNETITHVEVIKVKKTGEVQLFLGSAVRGSSGHSTATWKIFRVVKTLDKLNR